MIRTRLTLWNAVVLSVVLTALGTVLFATFKTVRYAAVDSDLKGRAAFLRLLWRDLQTRPKPPPPPSIDPMLDLVGDAALARHIAIEREISHPTLFSPRGKDLVDPLGRPRDPAGLIEAARGDLTLNTVRLDGVPARVISVPIKVDGKVLAVAQAAAPLDTVDEEVSFLAHVLWLMLPLAIIATSLTGIGITHQTMKPIRDIARAADRIESTNLSGRLPVRGHDELAELASTFNGMLGRLETSFLQLGSAFEAQRRFTADASHELKTPLTTIKVRTSVALQGRLAPETSREHFVAIGLAADEMSSIIRDLLLLALSDDGRLKLRLNQVSVSKLVHEAIESVTQLEGRTLEVRVPPKLRTTGDEEMLKRVLVNLLVNAARHTAPGDTVGVDVKRRGRLLALRVYDTGEGIPAEHLPFLFDRFYRVDSSRNRESGGSGLGLAIVKSIVEAHGGTVSIESEFGAGTSVRLVIPREAPWASTE